MLKVLIFLLATTLSLTAFSFELPTSRKELKDMLMDGHQKSSYNEARVDLFTRIDNHSGRVCNVYDMRKCITTNKVPDHTIMNTEHTWPQSKGATGIARSDLHHLFATDSHDNSTRSSFPFCDVVKADWDNGASKRGKSKYGEICFEPPAEHKGNVARAMFYFSVRYNHGIDRNQEEFLRKWHLQDPVDQAEIDRNERVFNAQKNRNLFINFPELVNIIHDF